MQNLEQAIREHAYHLWVADGCRDGAADTYWLSAQRELLNAALSASGIESPAMAEPAVAKNKAPAKPKAAKAATPAKPKRRAA
jgi:hypothetical protein